MAKSSCPHIGGENPDHRKQIHRLNRIIGQLNGVKSMIEAQDYCPDILRQTNAARSAIKSLEALILEDHLGHCVRDAFQSSSPKEAKAKIQELLELFKKI